MAKNTGKFQLTEDWTSVILGFTIIILSLAGLLLAPPSFSWKDTEELYAKVFGIANLLKMGGQFLFIFGIALVGARLTGNALSKATVVFPVIYLLTIFALLLAGSAFAKAYNLEAVIFSLGLGLLISNTMQLPNWFKKALSAEFFVKIGLVLLGTTVIFRDVLKAGSLGLIQALVVVVAVWYFAYWLCKKLRVDKEISLMIASAVSICGVSAAIATAGAIKGDSKKLSYVVSMVLITAVPMMIFMPMIARYLGLTEEVTGAWLGGSIDTTGAVVASGSLVGETALKISTIVKFSQNVLLGLAAFAISIYWTYNDPKADGKAEKPTVKIIWERFPKFVVGFLGASVLCSFFISAETNELIKGSLKSIQGLWFALAFTSIGLETNFKKLFSENSRKPLYAFLIAQFFNILLTLGIAYILF